MNQYPPIQVVDEYDTPLYGAPLKDVYQRGLLHRIVMVLVINDDGELLLQKRGPNVATHPNRWDVSAAGHVDEDEGYLDAAKREMKEEIGLEGVELIELDYFHAKDTYEGLILNRYKKLYKVIVPKKTKFKINKDEVKEVKWFKPQKIKDLINNHPDEIIYDFTEVLRRYFL